MAAARLEEATGDPPPQEVFLLDLVSIDETQATLHTLDGKEVKLQLRFHLDDLIDPALELNQSPYPGCALHVKDLGKIARQELGLSPTTPLHVCTKVIHLGEVLPMHKPLALLLNPATPYYAMAQRCCHFCRRPLRGNRRGGAPLVSAGPYNTCFFCMEAPAWHHGTCCPHNEASPHCDGPPHIQRYRLHWNMQHPPVLRRGTKP